MVVTMNTCVLLVIGKVLLCLLIVLIICASLSALKAVIPKWKNTTIVLTSAQDMPTNLTSTELYPIWSSEDVDNTFNDDKIIAYSTTKQNDKNETTVYQVTTQTLLNATLTNTTTDLPINLTSTEQSPISSSEDVDDAFADDEVIAYSTAKPNDELKHDQPLDTSQRFSFPETNGSKSFGTNFTTSVTQDLPNNFTLTGQSLIWSSEDVDDAFTEDEVIAYSTTKPNDKVKYDQPLETSQRFSFPETNGSKSFDFEDWDMMNENETTLYQEFNQTVLNEMKQRINQPGTSKITTTTPSSYTTELSVLVLEDYLFLIEDNAVTETTHRIHKIALELLANSGERIDLKNTHQVLKIPQYLPTNSAERDDLKNDHQTTKLSQQLPANSGERFNLKNSRLVTKIILPRLPLNSAERDDLTNKHRINKIPSRLPANSGERDDLKRDQHVYKITLTLPDDSRERDDLKIIISGLTTTTEDGNAIDNRGGDRNETTPITDEPDYDLEEAMKDPCNYEKFSHTHPTIERSGKRVSEIKCEEYMWDYKIEVLDVEVNRKECANKMAMKKEHVTEIFGGLKAAQGDFPHMGAVGWILKNGDIKWMCGSSLISPRFTLTAAHCRAAPTKLLLHRESREPEIVRFGSVFLDKKVIDSKNIMAEDVYIEQFLVLEEYAKYPHKKYNDIGLIKLRKEVETKLYIKPACLWNGDLGNSWIANVTGWGKTTDAAGSESKYLRYAEVDFIELNTCKKYVHGRKNRHWSEGLKDHQFCAGKLQGGIDACQGDSGGPLQIWSPLPASMNSSGVVHHVVGITSFGIKCGYPFLPGIYTKVASFLCWIEKTVWPEEINPYCP